MTQGYTYAQLWQRLYDRWLLMMGKPGKEINKEGTTILALNLIHRGMDPDYCDEY